MDINICFIRWLPPEVKEGDDGSEKSDIYSLGLVMWELITKEEPYAELGWKLLISEFYFIFHIFFFF
jgi:serine/threonine protein kinase